MSVKLGDTDIAGTQVLYSTTGSNTDGAMTQAATTTQLGLKANDADVVHIVGTETIPGPKTFTGSITLPAGTVLTKQDNNIEGGELVFQRANNDPLAQDPRIDLYGGVMRFLHCNAVQVPASAELTTAVSTTGISKAANGYVKFGNGLIVQWGDVTVTSVPHTVNLSTAMSAYKVVATPYGTTGNNREICITGQTTTTFSAAVVNATRFFWIAIGY